MQVAVNMMGTCISFLNAILHCKEPGLLEELADSKAREGKVLNEPGIYGCSRKLEGSQRTMRIYQRDGRTS